MSLVLALEFDPDRGRILKRLVGEWTEAEVVVASSTDQAIEFMHRHGPDLILVSALTPPGDDSSLTEFLRRMPGPRQVPALMVPPFVDPDDQALQSSGRRGLRSLFGRQPRPRFRHSYDQQALSTRLREALEASCAAAQTSAREIDRFASPALPPSPVLPEVYDRDLEQLLQDFARSHGDGPEPDDQDALDRGDLASMRARAQRWSSKDLSWLTEVKLAWGLRVDLLNISSSGLLVESAAHFVEGSSTVFQLSGRDRRLVIPARVVRSEVAAGNSHGVTYQAAAIFDAVVEREVLRPENGQDVPQDS